MSSSAKMFDQITLTADQILEKHKARQEAQRGQSFVDFLLSCPEGCNYDDLEAVRNILDQIAFRYSKLVFYELVEKGLNIESAIEAEHALCLLNEIKEYLRRVDPDRA